MLSRAVDFVLKGAPKGTLLVETGETLSRSEIILYFQYNYYYFKYVKELVKVSRLPSVLITKTSATPTEQAFVTIIEISRR